MGGAEGATYVRDKKVTKGVASKLEVRRAYALEESLRSRPSL